MCCRSLTKPELCWEYLERVTLPAILDCYSDLFKKIVAKGASGCCSNHGTQLPKTPVSMLLGMLSIRDAQACGECCVHQQ